MTLQQQQDTLIHKTFTIMIRVAIIFAIPAILAFFLGRYIDERFAVRPNGTLIVLGITFVGSWITVIRMYLSIDRQFRVLREKQEEEDSKNV